MAPRKSYPKWFHSVCYGAPVGAFVLLSGSVAVGVAVNPYVFVTVSTLSWYMISHVLGIKRPLRLPRKSDTPNLE